LENYVHHYSLLTIMCVLIDISNTRYHSLTTKDICYQSAGRQAFTIAACVWCRWCSCCHGGLCWKFWRTLEYVGRLGNQLHIRRFLDLWTSGRYREYYCELTVFKTFDPYWHSWYYYYDFLPSASSAKEAEKET